MLLEDLEFTDDAIGMAKRIIEAVGAPVVLDGREVFVGALGRDRDRATWGR